MSLPKKCDRQLRAGLHQCPEQARGHHRDDPHQERPRDQPGRDRQPALVLSQKGADIALDYTLRDGRNAAQIGPEALELGCH